MCRGAFERIGERGQITVFLSMLLGVFLTLALTCVEAGRYQMGKGRAAHTLLAAAEHTLADYNQELANRYDLYDLDETYNDKGREEWLNRVQEHLSYALSVPAGSRLTVKDVDIQTLERLNPKTLQEEIRIRAQGPKERTGYLKQDMNGAWSGQGSANTDPQESINQALHKGLLKIVAKNIRVSAAKAVQKDLPSKTMKKEPKAEENLIDRGVTIEYIYQSFDSLTTIASYPLAGSDEGMGEGAGKETEANEGAKVGGVGIPGGNKEKLSQLSYEMEYILSGKSSDKENLEEAAQKIANLRLPINLVCLHGDGAKVAEAEGLALLIGGASANPIIIEGLKQGILAAWAYGESLLDVKLLMEGNRIPTVKSSQDWQLSLSNVSNLAGAPVKKQDRKDGLSYTDYLKLLLASQWSSNTKYLHMLDVMQMNLQLSNQHFRISHCIAAAQVDAIFQMDAQFGGLPFQEGGSYTMEQSQQISYIRSE